MCRLLQRVDPLQWLRPGPRPSYDGGAWYFYTQRAHGGGGTHTELLVRPWLPASAGLASEEGCKLAQPCPASWFSCAHVCEAQCGM